jgi:hypothetical protein
MAKLWLITIGVSIIFSALASKTHRINVIMRNAKKFRRIKVSVKSTLIPIVVAVAGRSRTSSPGVFLPFDRLKDDD